MSFQFLVIKVWEFEELSTVHAIGLLEEGTINPPELAVTSGGNHEETIEIESIALCSRGHITNSQNELTLVIRCEDIAPKHLEGVRLVSVGSK